MLVFRFSLSYCLSVIEAVGKVEVTLLLMLSLVAADRLLLCDRGYSFERNCVLRRWESETLK